MNYPADNRNAIDRGEADVKHRQRRLVIGVIVLSAVVVLIAVYRLCVN